MPRDYLIPMGAADRMTTAAMRRCLLTAVLGVIAAMGTAEASAELGLDETTIRRRRRSEDPGDWTLEDLAMLMAWERDQADTRLLLGAIHESDGRSRQLGSALMADASARSVLRSCAEAVAHLAAGLDDGTLSPQEIRAAIPELEQLIPKIESALADLREKVKQ